MTSFYPLLVQCLANACTDFSAHAHRGFRLHACRTGYVTQARTHSGPVQDIPCGVQVPVDYEPTLRAIVKPLGKGFRDFCPAGGTLSAGTREAMRPRDRFGATRSTPCTDPRTFALCP